jgi:hypothetical protein
MAGTGSGKTGGRQKGTPNKSTQQFVERMDELRAQGLDCDPIQVLMEFAAGKQFDPDGNVVAIVPPVEPRERIKAAAELCSYVFPKRKAMEVSGDLGTSIQFIIAPDPVPLPSESVGSPASKLPDINSIPFKI